MLLTKTFMNKILSRLESIEDRLASDRRAVPVPTTWMSNW